MAARVRILSENAIAGIKRFKTVTETFRNHTKHFAESFMLLACGRKEFSSNKYHSNRHHLVSYG